MDLLVLLDQGLALEERSVPMESFIRRQHGQEIWRIQADFHTGERIPRASGIGLMPQGSPLGRQLIRALLLLLGSQGFPIKPSEPALTQ